MPLLCSCPAVRAPGSCHPACDVRDARVGRPIVPCRKEKCPERPEFHHQPGHCSGHRRGLLARVSASATDSPHRARPARHTVSVAAADVSNRLAATITALLLKSADEPQSGGRPAAGFKPVGVQNKGGKKALRRPLDQPPSLPQGLDHVRAKQPPSPFGRVGNAVETLRLPPPRYTQASAQQP